MRFLCWVHVEKENLCLYGYANEVWEVALPAEEVPTELPEPALGINFARDGMNRRDWLALVAVHSDSWLISVAFYYAARLNRNDRYHPTSFVSVPPGLTLVANTCYLFLAFLLSLLIGTHLCQRSLRSILCVKVDV
jgi:hypothetical protein